MRAKLSSRNIFLLISMVLISILTILSFYIIRNQFTEYMIDDFKENNHKLVTALALEHLHFEGTTSLKTAGDLKGLITSLISDENTEEAKITDANGIIIASSNTNDVGQGMSDDRYWRTAITGTPVLIKNGSNAYILTPLTANSGNVRGVVIQNTYLPNSIINSDTLTKNIAAIIFGVTFAFALIAYFIMYELEDRMAEKERFVIDKSRAHEEEKQLYEAITSSIAESLIVINKNNQILMVNPEAERLLGFKANDVEYRSYEKIINFYDENGKKIKKDPIAESLKKGQVVHVTSKDCYFVKSQTKRLIPISINIAPILGKSSTSGVAVTIIDISNEQELQKVKDEFVYVVAHELGNPIFALDGYLSMLEEHEKKANKETKNIIKGAHSINLQLSSLVNDLLEVSRNETGRLTFELENIDLIKVAKEVLKNSQFKASEKNIKIHLKSAPTAEVVANERKIKEVLTNLIDNAIKYTEKNGKIEVDIFEHDGRIVTQIKDNGIGMTKEDQKHLFEKFYRVRNKSTEGISGTGLGLFIAKQIIEKCGGEIWATSEESKGSTFSFSLKIKNLKKKG